jgi:hypothetical protein
VLLWQMAYGNRPWAGLSHAAIVRAVCVERRQLAFAPRPGGDGPGAIELLASACMAHDPAERPTFDEILGMLGALGDAAKGAAAAPPRAAAGAALAAARGA